MKSELYKLNKSGLLYILSAIILISMFVFAMIFNFSSKGNNVSRRFGYDVEKYDDFKTVAERIEECETEIKETKTSFENGKIKEEEYEYRLESLTITKNVYSYLLENKIKYNDAQCIDYFSQKDDKVIFAITLAFQMQNFIVVAMAVIIFYCLNHEFQNGTYKFVYSSGPPRWKIGLNKVSAILVSYVLLSLLYVVSMALLSLPYDPNYNILIVVTGQNVDSISSAMFVAKVFFSTFIDNFCWVILFTGISFLFKNMYLVIGAYLGSYAILEIMFALVPVSFLNAMAIQLFNIHTYDITIGMYSLATAIKYVLFSLFFASSFYGFCKRDLA